MKGIKKIILLLFFFGFFMFFKGQNVKAASVLIEEKPVASDIVYGQPLYVSELMGGVSNVAGIFHWKEEGKILNAGIHEEIVVFSSENNEDIEMSVVVNVLQKSVNIVFEQEIKKQYDGNDYVSSPNYIVKGIIDNTVYVSGNIEIKLTSVFVGEDIPVEIKGLELKGERKRKKSMRIINSLELFQFPLA